MIWHHFKKWTLSLIQSYKIDLKSMVCIHLYVVKSTYL